MLHLGRSFDEQTIHVVFKYFPLRLFTRCREIKKSYPAAIPDNSLIGSSKTASPVRGRWAACAPHVESAARHGVSERWGWERAHRVQSRGDQTSHIKRQALHSSKMSGNKKQRKTVEMFQMKGI